MAYNTSSTCLPSYDVSMSSYPSKLYTPAVLRLPDELLSHILEITTAISADEDPLSFVPIQLSQICHRIRVVALSTGSLWKKIFLCFPLYSEDVLALSVRLNRSKTCPLDIVLDMRDSDWDLEFEESDHDFSSKDMNLLLSILLPHVERWRSFQLLTDTWEPMQTFLSRTQVIDVPSLPLLESIDLNRCNGYLARKGQTFEPQSCKLPLPLFGGYTSLPNLRTLSLCGVHLDWDRSPLQNLTSLQFKFHSYDVMPTLPSFASLLKKSPQLSSLTILGWGPQLDSMEGGDSSPVISLRSLTNLTLGFLDAPYAEQLLSILDFPSLEVLHLEDLSTMLAPDDRPDFSPLLRRCFEAVRRPFPLASIKSLTLHGIQSLNWVTLQLFLRQMKSLTDLELIDMDNRTFRCLLPYSVSASKTKAIDHDDDDSSSPLLPCPSLQTISCRAVDIISLAGILSIRKSLDLSSPFRFLKFNTWESTGWDAVRNVKGALSNLGVDFELNVMQRH